MKKKIRDSFVPHSGNSYKPHIFEKAGLVLVLAAVVGVFMFSGVHRFVLENASRFIAAVVPGVLIDITNESRANEAELAPLRKNSVLEVAAQLKADDMAEHSYFEHTSPAGIDPWHWFEVAGYEFLNAGENLAVNFSDSEDVVRAWLNSPGHRANILNRSFTEIGIATSEGRYKGQDVVFVVQLFGTPRAASVAALPAERVVEPVVLGEESTEVSEVTLVEESSATLEAEEVEEAEEFNDHPTEASPPIEYEPVPQYSSGAERILSSPSKLLSLLYMLVAAVLLFSLILVGFLEFQKHHIKNVVYVALVIILMALMWYLNTPIFGGVLVV